MTKSVIYFPKVNLDAGAAPPNSWESSNGYIPDGEFVVSRTPEGTVLSRYSDLFWDFSPYHRRGRTVRLYFYLFEDQKDLVATKSLVDEMRHLMFLVIWKRPGKPLSISSLHNYINLSRRLGCFAFSKGCRIQDVLNSQQLLAEFVHGESSGTLLKVAAALLVLLCKLGPDEVGFSVLGKEAQKIIQPYILRYFSKLKQYPPIPSRIYSAIISGLLFELDEWERVESRYLSLLQMCLNNPLIGKNKHQQITLAGKSGIDRTPGLYERNFSSLLEEFDLVDYFESRNLSFDVRGMLLGLTGVMLVAKLTVVTFTGMRNAEALHLPYGCIEEEKVSGGRVHRLVNGDTTKLMTIRTHWVTNAEGHRAIRIAQRLAGVIYRHVADEPPSPTIADDRYPLFVSTAYLGLSGKSTRAPNGNWKALSSSFHKKRFDGFRRRIEPLISEDDLRELEFIDAHRAWRSEDEFQIGTPWRLTDHQLRRSLALYAQRSGLVSLPSLRRQLQHITEEMSRYYARGSVFARNFIGNNKEHFGLEWQEATPMSSGLAFIRDVLFSSEPLFGGYVKWIEHRLNGPDGQILLDRDETLKRFRNGEMAYKETPLGGCAKVGPCDEVAIRFLDVDCLGGCPNLIGRASKLERVIKAQTTLVNSLTPGSVQWRIESADLEVLHATSKRMQEQRGEGL